MTALSLSKQQWRTYRQALEPLNKDRGRLPCFTAGDLLATAIVQYATSILSAPVSAFSEVAVPLFHTCGRYAWPHMERSHLHIGLEEKLVELIDTEQDVRPRGVGLLVPLAPLARGLRGTLLAAGPNPQQDLAFPPMVAGARR